MVIGHSVAQLLRHALKYDSSIASILAAGGLDKYNIPTRYPNGLPGGVPYEAFDEDDARKAMVMAESVMDYMTRAMEAA